MNKFLEKLKNINYKSKKAIICYIVAGAILISGTGIAVAINSNNKPANSNSIVADKDKDNNKEEFNPKDYYKHIKGIKEITVQKGTKVNFLDGVEFDKEYIKEIKVDDSKVDINKVGKYNLLYKITTKDNNTFGITTTVNVLDENKIKEEIKKGNEVITDKGIKNKKAKETLDKNKEDVKVTVTNTSTNTKPNNNTSSNNKPNIKPNNKPSESNKPQPEQPNNKPTFPSKPNKPTEPSKPTPPVHQHSWVPQYQTIHHPEEGHNEQVLVKPAWTEEIPIYEDKAVPWCNVCEKQIIGETPAQHGKKHALAGEGSGHRTEYIQVQVGTDKIEHPAEYTNKWVVDKQAWTENKLIGYTCSCGAKK